MKFNNAKIIQCSVFLVALLLTACNGGGGGAPAPASTNTASTYTIGGTLSGLSGTGLVLQNNAADNLAVSANGAFTFATHMAAGATYNVTVLTQPSGSTCTLQNGTGTANAAVTNVAVTCVSAGPLALVTNSGSTNGVNGMSVYRVNPSTGILSFLNNATAGNTPTAIAVTPNRLYAYVTNQIGGTVSSYSIDSVNGALNPIPLSSPSSLNPTGIAMDRLGRFIWVTNYGFNTVSAFAIGVNGVLAAAGAPLATAVPMPFAITAHPTMDYVYVANQSPSTHAVTVYSVNPASGALTLQQTLSNIFIGASGIVIDPSGRFAYVVDIGSMSICAFAINAINGQLTSNGCAAVTGGTPFALAIHPNGLIAYVVVDVISNNVRFFAINQTTGALTAVGLPVSAGSNPRGVTVNALGTYLYVTNYVSNNVSAFGISGGGGTLTSLGAAVPAGSFPQGIAVTP